MDFSSIPVLDISRLSQPDKTGLHEVAKELKGFLERIGLVYVTGYGVPTESVEAVREQSRRFHTLPLDEKLKLKINANFRGYIPINTSTIVTSSVAKVTKHNQSESLMIMHEVAVDNPAFLASRPLQGPNQWPSDKLLLDFRNTVETYSAEQIWRLGGSSTYS